MSEKLSLGLVGKGRWGKNYISTIRNLRGSQLYPENIRTRDYSELFAVKDLDGVIIATPIETHCKIAKGFLTRGFNILIEKPVTKTYAEAQELHELANSKPESIVMVGHIQLFDPTYSEMKKHLDKVGKISKLIFKGLGSPIRHGSTVLEDWGPHPVYLFLDLMNKTPKTVSAQNTVADNIRLEMSFGDCQATAEIGWTAERIRELLVIGESGTLTLNHSQPPKKLYFTDKRNNRKLDLDFPSDQSPLEVEVLHFIDCIKKEEQPKASLEQGVQVMKILDEANKSLGPDRLVEFVE